MGYTVESIDNVVEMFKYMQLDLLKETIESFGYDLGPNKNEVEYKNYMIDNPLEFGSPYNFGDPGADGFIPGGAAGDTGVSEAMFQQIVMFEQSRQFGYTMTEKDLYGVDIGDAGGHKTFGYGLLYHPVSGQYMDQTKSSYTQQELEQLYRLTVKKKVSRIYTWMQKNNLQLKQNQIDAIASACFNFGDGFLNKNIAKMIIANPNDPRIPEVWAHLSDVQGSKGYGGLPKRRAKEAAWYAA